MIEDYDSLKAEIAEQVSRSDVTADSDSVETDIQLAEKFISRELRVTQMEKEGALSTTASTATVDLPSDFLEARDLEFNSSPKNIEYRPRTEFKTLMIGAGSGRPEIYTIANNSTDGLQAVKFAPVPDSVYDLTVTYFASIPALSDSNTTNWLLSYDPELYLNTCLYFAFRRKRNKLAGEYLSLAKDRIKEMNDEENRKKLGVSGTRSRARNVV